MDHLTIREAYGHGLPLGIDAQIPQQILDLDELSIPSWPEIGKMRAHVTELITRPVGRMPGEDAASWRARNSAATAEAQAVMSAANYYASLRRGLEKVRSAARWGVSSNFEEI